MLTARVLLEKIHGSTPRNGAEPEVDGDNEVKNPEAVLLHRGSTRIRFKRDFKKLNEHRYTDFNENPDAEGYVDNTKEAGKGVSVSVLGEKALEEKEEEDMLKEAHKHLVSICRRRLEELLESARKEFNKTHDNVEVTKDDIKSLLSESKYMSVIHNIANCEIKLNLSEDLSLLKDINIPFCYTRIKEPFYPWAKLMKRSEPENKFHCHLELKQPTEENDIQEMAKCHDEGWCPCHYMLTAAAMPRDELREPELDPDLPGVTLSISDALGYLADDFAQGGNSIDIQEAFEICLYQARMARGDLTFRQAEYSGLHLNFRLASFVKRAINEGFYFEIHEDRSIIQQDLQHALSHTTCVTLFDSGDPDMSHFRFPGFREFPPEWKDFLIKLLRADDPAKICQQLKEEHLGIEPEAPIAGVNLHQNKFAQASRMDKSGRFVIADLLERNLDSPIAIKAGSATLMISRISDEVSLEFQRCVRSFPDVQDIFSVVMERFLLEKLGRATDKFGQGILRATDFITTANSVVKVRDWKLTIDPPTPDMPVTLGVIRVRSDRLNSAESLSKLGIQLHNLLYTMNHAMWRIPISHVLWCINYLSSFNLSKAIVRAGGKVVDKEGSKWADDVLRTSSLKLEAAEISLNYEKLWAKERGVNFVVIVTWDLRLCRYAVRLCQEELRRFRFKDDYDSIWTVDVKSNQLI